MVPGCNSSVQGHTRVPSYDGSIPSKKERRREEKGERERERETKSTGGGGGGGGGGIMYVN